MSSKTHRLVTYLETLRDRKDTAALAKLKRGLGNPKGTPEMYPYVVQFVEDGWMAGERVFLLASLFAFHPDPAHEGLSMGRVFAEIHKVKKTDSIEKRFVRLLEADIEDVGHHLRQAIALAKSERIAVDYHQLFYDLKYWDHEERFVQLSWAKDFWGSKKYETTDK